MLRLCSENVDIQLSQHYTSGIVHPYDVYYFDIYLHGTHTRVGYTDLRIGKSSYLYYLGNVGYRIDEPYRGHHYAREAVKMVLPYARKKGMKELTITCDPENEASRRTLDGLGGKCLGDLSVPFGNPLYFEGYRVKRVYCFDLEKEEEGA